MVCKVDRCKVSINTFGIYNNTELLYFYINLPSRGIYVPIILPFVSLSNIKTTEYFLAIALSGARKVGNVSINTQSLIL